MIFGRIIKGVGGLYHVQTEQGIFQCHPRGIFRLRNIEPLVGDQVTLDQIDFEEKTASIVDIQERACQLVRPKVANVTQALAVFAAGNPKPHLNMIDKLLVSLAHSQLEIILCINKVDLTNHEWIQFIKNIYQKTACKVLFLSAKEKIGLEELKDLLKGKISVLAGPSGVGKSSILNALSAGEQMAVGELSQKIQRGKHTTRHAELFHIGKDTFLMDAPGFGSVQLPHMPPEELAAYFQEFTPYRDKCKFANCQHLQEPACGVKEQIGISIAPSRYDNYVYFYQELKEKER